MLLAVSAGACSSSSSGAAPASSGSTTSTPTTSTAPAPTTPCAIFDLRIAVQAAKTAPAGHHPLLFALQNLGTKGCVLNGYPGVGYRDGGGNDVPVTVAPRGGLVVTSSPPAPVPIDVNGYAFFIADSKDCAAGSTQAVAQAVVTIPGDASATTISVPANTVPVCPAGDPGATIEVSPFVKDPNAALTR